MNDKHKPVSEREEPTPVPFQATNYSYEISVGTVVDKDAINWEMSINVQKWETVKQVAEMAFSHFDYPVIETEIQYKDGIP